MKHPVLATLAVLALLAGCGDNVTHPGTTSSTSTGATGGTGGTLPGVPNLDGKIEAHEFQAVLNTSVDFLVGSGRPVNLAGTTDGAGHLVWDFSPSYADDGTTAIQATSLADKWYAHEPGFAGGQWVAPADIAGEIEGVYSSDETAVRLHGLASKTESGPAGKTLLTYVTPIDVYRFPLAPGSAWTSESDVTGAIVGNKPYSGHHKYDIRDDATGQLELFDQTFTQVHRVRTTLTITNPQGADVVRRQTGFLFEYFGEVVRATAADGEANDDFAVAAELRRLKL